MDDIRGLVFKPFRKVNTFAGLEGKNWGKVLIVVLIGTIAFFLIGEIKLETQVSLNASEKLVYQEKYVNARQVEQKLQALIESQTLKVKNQSLETQKQIKELAIKELSEKDQEYLTFAEQNKITADMSDEDLNKLIPTTKTEYHPAISDIARGAIFIAIPMLISIAWLMDLRGWSYSTEVKRFNKYRKEKKFFVSKREMYLATD